MVHNSIKFRETWHIYFMHPNKHFGLFKRLTWQRTHKFFSQISSCRGFVEGVCLCQKFKRFTTLIHSNYSNKRKLRKCVFNISLEIARSYKHIGI